MGEIYSVKVTTMIVNVILAAHFAVCRDVNAGADLVTDYIARGAREKRLQVCRSLRAPKFLLGTSGFYHARAIAKPIRHGQVVRLRKRTNCGGGQWHVWVSWKRRPR